MPFLQWVITMNQPTSTEFERQLVAQRDYLMRFARLQLRNEAWAEDAVSETILAAVTKPQSFGNKSQLKTWLVGILKHKVIDVFRLNARTVVLDIDPESDGSEELDALIFKSDGHFEQAPADWGDPEKAMQSHQFLQVLEACIEMMPTAMGRVFLMREWLGLPSVEICKELELSPTNLYVTLHRARLRLRECLERNWFVIHPDGA